MSDFFYSLETDLLGFLSTINQNVNKLPSQTYGYFCVYQCVNPLDAKEVTISETQQHLREVEKCVKLL